MTSRFRLLATLACAVLVQSAMPGTGVALTSGAAGGAAELAGCLDRDDAGSDAMSADMDMSNTGDCTPPPCDGDMPDDACRTMPGCIVGAWMSPAPAGSVMAPRFPARVAAAVAPAPLSLSIAPEIPPPRA